MARNNSGKGYVINTVSSIFGSIVASVVCSPLDVIKVRLQIQVMHLVIVIESSNAYNEDTEEI